MARGSIYSAEPQSDVTREVEPPVLGRVSELYSGFLEPQRSLTIAKIFIMIKSRPLHMIVTGSEKSDAHALGPRAFHLGADGGHPGRRGRAGCWAGRLPCRRVRPNCHPGAN